MRCVDKKVKGRKKTSCCLFTCQCCQHLNYRYRHIGNSSLFRTFSVRRWFERSEAYQIEEL